MHRRREMSDQLVVRVVDLLAATTRRAADIELFRCDAALSRRR